jgi:hypothetical protein
MPYRARPECPGVLRCLLVVVIAVIMLAAIDILACRLALKSPLFSETGGIKLVGAYARITNQASCFEMGASTPSGVSLPDFRSTDPVCLKVGQDGNWRMATGALGTLVGKGSENPARGTELPVPGKTRVNGVDFSLDVEIVRAPRLLVEPKSGSTIVVFNPLDTSKQTVSELQGSEISGGNGRPIQIRAGDGQVTTLHTGKRTLITVRKSDSSQNLQTPSSRTEDERVHLTVLDDDKPVPKKQSGSVAPFSVSVAGEVGNKESRRTFLLWPDTTEPLSGGRMVLRAFQKTRNPLRFWTTPEQMFSLSVTDPNFVVNLPDAVHGDLGVAEGTKDEILTIQGHSFRLKKMTLEGDSGSSAKTYLLVIRVPRGIRRYFPSWDDSALFHPYPFVSVGQCLTDASGSPSPTTGADGPNVTAPVTLAGRRTPAASEGPGLETPSDAQVDPTNESHPAFCREGKAFRITATDNSISSQVPIVGFNRRGSAALQARSRDSAQYGYDGDFFLTGDHLYQSSGQIYQLVDAATPASLVLFVAGAPFVLGLAALPLLWLLAVHQQRLWIRFDELNFPAGPNTILRRLTLLTPIVVAVLILSLMTIGSCFQLSLAASSQLAATGTYFNDFLVSGLLAIATVTLVLRWMLTRSTGSGDPTEKASWTWAGLGRGIQEGLLVLAIGAIMIGWVEPLVRHYLWRKAETWSFLPQATSNSRWLPIGLLILYASWWVVRRIFSRISTWDGMRGIQDLPTYIANLCNEQYDEIGKRYLALIGRYSGSTSDASEQESRSGKRVQAKEWWPLLRYFGRVLAFLLGWVFFPLAFARTCLPSKKFFENRFAKRGIGVASILLLFVCGFLSRHSGPFASLGKEAAPPLVLLWAASLIGALTRPSRNTTNEADSASNSRASSDILAVSCILAFSAAICFLPYLFRWVYDPRIVVVMFLASLASFGVWFLPDGAVTGKLLVHLLPFYVILAGIGWIFNDVGAMLAWVWTLSAMGAWVLMLNTSVADTGRSRWTWFGTLLCSIALVSVPLTLIGIVDWIRNVPALSAVADSMGLTRALSRFRLTAAPFYYNQGEWLTRVERLAATEPKVQHLHWISNLHSDVALNGLHHQLPAAHGLAIVLLGILFLGMALCFGEAFRYAVQFPEDRHRYLKAALVIATAFFGLGMFLFVHLGASLFDILPLTGIPCPWISHSKVVHIVMTTLVLGALCFAAEQASPEKG